LLRHLRRFGPMAKAVLQSGRLAPASYRRPAFDADKQVSDTASS
jgi:hypothetical protein